MFNKILWVTDFSQHAHRAGIWAAECTKCGGGTLLVLTIVDPEEIPTIVEDIPDPFISSDTLEQLTQQLADEYEQKIRERLREEVESLGLSSTKTQMLIKVGVPSTEIVRTAKEMDANLIVIGSHGRRTIADIILGSTVDNVIKNAHCPVLVVR